MKELIQRTRNKFGTAPRRFDISVRDYHYIKPPNEDTGNDLMTIFRDQDLLFGVGQVVWARTVQVNSLAFEIHRASVAGSCVYSLDPYFDDNFDELDDIGQRLFDLKGTQVADPQLAYIVDAITNENTVIMNQVLPPSFTNGRQVYFTLFFVYRPHLPLRFLNSIWFPLMVRPDLTPAAIILPSEYWDEQLKHLWME